MVPGENPMLFNVAHTAAGLAGFFRRGLLRDHGLDLTPQLGIVRRPLLYQFVFGCELQAGGAEDRVHACGEDGDYSRFCAYCRRKIVRPTSGDLAV